MSTECSCISELVVILVLTLMLAQGSGPALEKHGIL